MGRGDASESFPFLDQHSRCCFFRSDVSFLMESPLEKFEAALLARSERQVCPMFSFCGAMWGRGGDVG